MKNKEKIIKQTIRFVKNTLEGEGSGHDWWHIYRVWKNALFIGKKENVDMFVVQLSALLHDIVDWKFQEKNDFKIVKEWLEKLNVDKNVISHVLDIIKEISFKGVNVKSKIKTREGMVVQDADRLDAMGAIGIARAFAYGGSVGREIYNPNIKPKPNEFFKTTKKKKGTTINHFYEKLLLLKNLMNTKTGKKIAKDNHNFMKKYLEKFLKEWEGKY